MSALRASGATPRETSVLRPLWMQVYLPNLVLATGQGAILPILALAAKHVGASSSVAAVVVALNGLGTMLFDLPSGQIVAKFGEVRAGWVAAALLIAGLVGTLESHNVAALGFFVFLAASGWAVWNLVRLTHLSRVAPIGVRGRALSVFGGVTRAGNVAGPLIVAAITTGKNPTVAFLVYLICVVVGFVWLTLSRDRSDAAASRPDPQRLAPIRTLTDHRREFATAGVGSFGIGLLRGSRTAIVPLWGMHIGLTPGQVSLIFGLSSILDLAMFYPAGIVSDRFGRKAVAVPCILILSVGHLLLPFTHAFSTLFYVALMLGLGNGLGSGIVMTMGADRAPATGRAAFLAVWRFVSDSGTAAGPLIESGVIAVASLAFAPPAVGVVGLMSGVVVAKWLSEPRGEIAEVANDP